jgi:hypothetical protein
MHLLWFIIVLALTGIIFTRLEPLLIAPTLLLTTALHKKSRALFHSGGVINYIWSTYILLCWCAFCALLTDWCIFESIDPLAWHAPVVGHPWLYYVVGFFGCFAPVQYMASFDLRSRPANANPLADLGTTIAVVVTVVAFIVFTYAPRLRLPWAWLAFWLSK